MFRIHMLPAADGDCFLIETGTSPHRILIDGGRKATATALLPYLQSALPRRKGPLLNLMVLTHIDGDHIGGLLELMPRMADTDIGEIWFNGLRHARIARGDPPPPLARPAWSRKQPLPVLTFRQANEFDQAVATRGWPWNASFADTVAAVAAEGALPVIPLPDGGKITLLGPPRAKLGAFANEWEFWYRKLSRQHETLGISKSPEVAIDKLPALAAARDVSDTAGPNGTSITFIIEYSEKRALFCADAHPDDVANALIRYGGPQRQRFDAIKVAHHGSAANNTSKLVERLESPLWLVSTNGSGHGHPNAEAMARIVLARASEERRILFNYASKFSQAWADPKIQQACQYKAELPAPGQIATVVDLL
ncbi:MBL fold metallo-hydrolase [Mesorhizobium sp. M0522]|uniref:ComEC/Rec2 family competence protein n=1 Tax=unclassified Mesorhizobium TaxID=325217 RepID=UPI003337E9D7